MSDKQASGTQQTREFEVACRHKDGGPLTIEVEAEDEQHARQVAESREDVGSVESGEFAVVPFRRAENGEKRFGGNDAQ